MTASFIIRMTLSLISTARDRLKTLFSKSTFFFERMEYIDYVATPIQEILLDMSSYESDGLVQGSLHLLNRCYSSEISLFESAMQTQLLFTKESQKVFIVIYLQTHCVAVAAHYIFHSTLYAHTATTVFWKVIELIYMLLKSFASYYTLPSI